MVDAAKKRNMISKIGREGSFNPVTTNFLQLLVDKGRIELLEDICEAYEAEYCKVTDTQARSASCPSTTKQRVLETKRPRHASRLLHDAVEALLASACNDATHSQMACCSTLCVAGFSPVRLL